MPFHVRSVLLGVPERQGVAKMYYLHFVHFVYITVGPEYSGCVQQTRARLWKPRSIFKVELGHDVFAVHYWIRWVCSLY